MLRLLILLYLCHSRTAFVTDQSLSDRLDRLYEKLEKFKVVPVTRPPDKLYAKLDRLNALSPNLDLSDEDEELLSAMQQWGVMSQEQISVMVKELQMLKETVQEETEKHDYDGEYEELQDLADGDNYANDGSEDWDPEDDHDTTSKSGLITGKSDPTTGKSDLATGKSDLTTGKSDQITGKSDQITGKSDLAGVTPSAFTRYRPGFREVYESAEDPIAATNERPRILDDSSLTVRERAHLRRAAVTNMATVVRASKCLTPQPRWLVVRHLAPAADTVYMPPCVQLHRCAPDSGCCYDEAEVCAPVDGRYVAIPFYLHKADDNVSIARILFFNHTRCACVSRDSLHVPSTARSRMRLEDSREVRERQSDWRAPTDEPKLEKEDERTAPPLLRRCTCPTLFQARVTDSSCSCECEWPDASRRRDCLSLSRGWEHFGLRDRVCVANGDCTTPTCVYGLYDRNRGQCPQRKYRRLRLHARSKY